MRLLLAWWVMFALCGCRDDGPGPAAPGVPDGGTDDDAGPCVDGDGDGAGVGASCELLDCDDTDPFTIDLCGTNCEERPLRAGCRCDGAGAVVPCFMGVGEPQGVCLAGAKHCTPEGWGICEGQILPEGPEVCDGVDNDCSGEVDEGLTSECGGCDDDCRTSCAGFDCDQDLSVEPGWAIAGEDGSIGLRDEAVAQRFILWAPGGLYPEILEIDTRSRAIIGDFLTGPEGGYVKRAAADLSGNVAASSTYGRVTMILAGDCPDRNGDGVVQTSTGFADLLEWTEEAGPSDECVAWSMEEIAGEGGRYGALAFEVRPDLDGTPRQVLWVGSGERVVEVDPATGETTGRTIDRPANAMAIGPVGVLWSNDGSDCLVATDTATLEETEYDCPPARSSGSGWTLTVDHLGRAWVGGSPAARFDPSTEVWEMAGIDGGSIAVDRAANAYAGAFINGETLQAQPVFVGNTGAWGIDLDGDAWALLWGLEEGDADIVDPQTGQVTRLDLQDGRIERGLLSGWTGDFTGYQLRNVTPTDGFASTQLELCDAAQIASVRTLSFVADLPEGAAILFDLRHGATEEDLHGAAWSPVGTAAAPSSELDLATALAAAGVDPDRVGPFVEVRATLKTLDWLARPSLSRIEVLASCAAP